MRGIAVLALVACLAACQTPGIVPLPAFNLIDLTGHYTAFYERSRSMESTARIESFKAGFATVIPGFYDPERVKSFATREQYDRLIERSFEAFPDLRARYERTAASFAEMLSPALIDFKRTFPDLVPLGDVYLLHSLGEMDGGTRTISGRRRLVFGADVMARLYMPGDERPFFQHELFHVYHAQYFGECNAVWCAVWREGLAVYVSAQLNPGATDTQLLLTMPRPIRPEVDANLPEAVCTIRARLSSEQSDDYAPMFQGRAHAGALPPRYGYYVGYLVAREAARTRATLELAHMSVDDVRPVVEAALASLSDCPAHR